MTPIKRYLSFGGGVNSTALLVLLTEEGLDFETVFVNHGTDYPETYAYVELLRSRGYDITEIKPAAFGGYESLLEYCQDAEMVPVRMMRWCTDHFKMKPLYSYFDRPCEVYIGIDAGEERRAKESRDKQITNVFPLVDRGIDRTGCVEIIEAAGLPVPPKSGCYICPFQRRDQWIRLNKEYPDLWCKVAGLDQQSIERQKRAGKEGTPFYLAGRPLDDLIRAKDGRGRYVSDDQYDMFDDRRPCQCGL